AQPAVDALRRRGILAGVVDDLLRENDGAVGRVDVDAHGCREPLQQLLGALGQLIGVLRRVLAVDDHPRLLAGVRVRANATTLLESRRRRGESAGVLGNRAVLVAGLFRTG